MSANYTQNTIDNARLILPQLIYYAQLRKTITYGELGEKVGKHHRVIPRLLGYIRDEICIPRNIPIINAIVVNIDTGLPGESWLPEGTSHLSEENYRAKFENFRDRVFAYSGWGDLLRELNLKPVEPEPEDLNEIGRVYSEILQRTGGGGEGEDHLRLKEYIAAHPEAIGVEATSNAHVEYAFITGDCADIVHDLGNGNWAVIEIKNGQTGELVRGVYQLVKYRALLQAEKGQGRTIAVDVFLVAYNIPAEITLFAGKFGIRCKIIREIP